MNRVVINIVGFQVGWFSCVLGAAQAMPWLGPLVAAPILAWHLLNAANIRDELKLIIVASLLGALFDQTLLSAGLLRFADSAAWPAYLLPAWMMALWLLFNTTLNVGLRWMRGRILIAALFGFIGGPLAYLAGAKLGAIKLLDMPILLAVLGIGWGVLMPILLWLSTIFDGYAPMDDTVTMAPSDV
ncbi:MAG TPA: DUF2878 domain-containing protein [Methylophilaceae bacterium]|nr:DUF2878 domain-containing protein [Methylophilaceae bacterium]